MAPDEQQDDRTQSFVALTKGALVGHYRIIEKIGAGGMGEVYLAEDAELDRKVALKFLASHLCRDEDCRKRFKREAQAAAKLDHPNIIPVYEVDEYQGRPYFVMVVIEGQSLREFVSGKELSVERILEIGIQICEGLQAAHVEGITHRDIKPSNILIDSQGRARIVDFGLASIRGSDALTKTGSTLGTIGYMSPEQVQGKEVDQRSDLFSLGVVLYELITNQNPFRRDSEAATLRAVSDDTPHPLARYRADVPGGLQATVDKALEKVVKMRYQHADGMLSDLVRVKRALESKQTAETVPSKPGRSPGIWWFAAAVVIIAAIILIAISPWSSETTSDRLEKIMLVVLPFDNLGAPEDEYFADGITDEITARLARISRLRLTSRTSAMQYKDTDKSLKQIGNELGVEYVLEGTVRWDKSGDINRVRITPLLIHVAEDAHLWADVYEKHITDIFHVQADIAEQVVEALDIVLLEPEREALETRPTDNMEAYDYYLRGLDYSNRGYAEEDIRIAVQMFEKAVELDTGFVLAYAELSYAHADLYWFFYDRSEDCLARSKEAVDKAFQFNPNSAEAHRAMGWYYYHGLLDYDRALEHFSIALKTMKDNGNLLLGIAAVQRRQGKLEEAIVNFRKALEVDPRSAENAYNLAESYALVRNFAEAESHIDYAISMAPDWLSPYALKARLYLLWEGNTKKARDIVERAPQNVGSSLYKRIINTLVLLDMFDKDYQAALGRLSHTALDAFETQFYYVPKAQLQAEIYGLTGQLDLERAYYDSASNLLESRIQEQPEDSRLHSALGIAYAGLGRKQDAIREAKKAVELLPISKEAYRGYYRAKDLAHVYTMVGEYDAAIDQLGFLLSVPGDLSVPLLELDPIWDSLRDHPRFQALLEKYENEFGT